MTDSLIGRQFSNYRLDREIGRGGMATVYYGWDSSLERPVAIKVVNAQFRDNPAYAQRFVQEARTVATWRHNNILQVFYAGQEDALSYFVMEYVDGPDLGQVMRQYADDGELMPADDVLRLGKAIASALDYAHKQNVIHRDVKPANVMIAKDGRVVLADFGLALNTQQGSIGEIFGTPHYIAPEQARNSATAVPQSDLYALGVILYEMLTGVVPFDDPSPTSLAVQHITQPPPDPISINPRLNVETQDVLLKALSKMPADRYETGAALMAALEKALGSSKTAVSNTNLPPFPTGIVAPAMSQRSVAERVSFFLPPPPVAAPVPAPTSGGYRAAPSPIVPAAIPAAAPHTNSEVYVPKKQPWGLFAIGIIAILIVILFVGRALMGGTDELVESPTATSDVALVLPTVPTESSVVENALATVAPATASSAVETNSDPVPTATTIDEPVVVMETAVSIATEPTIEAQPDVAPTVLYPNGHRLELLYNPTSLYLFNASSEQIRISTFFFEALNANGDPVGYSFDGYRWSQFYSYAASNGCVRLEVAKLSDYLRPAKCRAYNSTVNPPENDPQRFWIERPDVTQFRVSYQGEEIARCPIPGDYCEVYIP